MTFIEALTSTNEYAPVTQEAKRGRGRPRKDTKLVRYAVLWVTPDVAEALQMECGDQKKTTIVRRLIGDALRLRGRLPPDDSQKLARP